MWIAQIISSLLMHLKKKNTKAAVIRRIKTLSKGEKSILFYCLINNQQTTIRPITDIHVSKLADKGILKIGKGLTNKSECSYTIHDFVWNYLQENKHKIFSEQEIEKNSP